MEAIKQYRIVIAVALLLAMIGVTWWAVTKNTGDTPEEDLGAQGIELPEIDRGELTEISIQRPDDEAPTRLVKEGDAWRLAAPVEAPAARTQVETMLDKLGALELAGVAARQARHHERLEVDEEHGVHVIARAGDREVIDFWIGGFQSGSTMIRLDGRDEVLMVQGSIKFAFNRAPSEWRDREILALESDEVREATFAGPNGTFRFRKNEDAWEQVLEPAAEGEDPPAGIENFDATKVRTAVNMLARLRAAEFAAPDVTEESAGLTGESAARVTLVSGEGDDAQTTTVIVGNEVTEGQRYVKLEGGDTIFVVARSHAERLVPNAETFQQSDEPPPAEGEGEDPHGEGGPPGGGQIPPEIMEQIQRQLQQRGAGGGHE